MKPLHQRILTATLALTFAMGGLTAYAQRQEASEGSTVRRRTASERTRADRQTTPGVTDRMASFFGDTQGTISDADVQWMRIIYREIDLDKDRNAALYYPEEPVEGQENLFRIIMRLLADNRLAAYEYLDGREIFTDQYRVKVRDVLDRFHILYTDAKGSTERNPHFVIEEADVPSNEVLSYYIIERWQYDTRNNRLRPAVEAICPVLHRSGDFGGEAVRYPMFWVKMADIRPHLAQQPIFVDDDNNMPTCTYDDFFTLTLYEGDIYKTRNLKNRSMMQLYPDADARKKAQDSIQARLDNFEKKLWTPTREEVLARNGDTAATDSAQVTEAEVKKTEATRSTKRSSKRSKVKESKPKTTSSSAVRSVRRRK